MKATVFDYLDYRDLLKDAYEAKKAAWPLYSYRMLAETLGQDASNVFRILQKDAHLPARCQSRAIEFLGLTGRSAEYFVLLVAYARERDPKARQQILEKALALRDVPAKRLQELEYDYFKDWWTVVVRALVEVMGGDMQPEAVAKRLSPSVKDTEVTESLKLLLELGLVKKASSGRFALAQAHLNAGGEKKTQAIRGFQRQILTLAAESIDRFPKDERDVSTLTLAVDEQAFEDIRGMLHEFRQQIQKRVDESSQPDRVMQLSLAFFPLAPATEASK